MGSGQQPEHGKDEYEGNGPAESNNLKGGY